MERRPYIAETIIAPGAACTQGSEENKVRSPLAGGGGSFIGVYAYEANEAKDAGEALGVAIYGVARVLAGGDVSAGSFAEIKDETGAFVNSTGSARVCGMFLQNGSAGEYVEMFVAPAPAGGGSGGGGGVSSVNGRTGAVTLGKTDVGLSSVENTSDLDKPLSTEAKAYIDSRVYALSGSLPDGVDPVSGDWRFPLSTQSQWTTSIGPIIPKIGDIVFYSKKSVWYAGMVLAVQLSSPWMCTVRPVRGALVQPPTADGTYTLQCAVSGGNPVFSWG
jgi:hypothetical protein